MLDLESLDLLREVMEDEFGPLIELYIADSDARFPLMRNELADGNADSLRNIVHSFKGASSNICAPALTKQAQKVEHRARDGLLVGLEEDIASLEISYQLVRAELQAML
ncbi:MAG: Hpt domain-containing protein [Thalassolituus sp.]